MASSSSRSEKERSHAASLLSVREQLGEEAARGIEEYAEALGAHWREQVMQTAAERFDRRLATVGGDLHAEVAGLRLEMADFRLEMQKRFGGIRQTMADLRVELLRWSFFFWVGQVIAVASLLAFMLRGIAPR
jgi:hypothetical protein